MALTTGNEASILLRGEEISLACFQKIMPADKQGYVLYLMHVRSLIDFHRINVRPKDSRAQS